jgi:hypothetical protein
MKKFIIVGAISVGVAVCVLLAWTSVSTMADGGKGGTKWMIIKVNAETGEVIVTDEENNMIEPIDSEMARKILGGRHPIEYVGTLAFTHKSPGCIVWYDIWGFPHVKCWPPY